MAMAVPIELAGTQHWLRYDLNALSVIEERLNISLVDLKDLPISMRFTRTVLWAGLLHAEPSLTEQTVGSWVDGSNFAAVSEQILRAFALGFGENGKAAGVPNPSEPAGTSSSVPPTPSST